MTIRLLKNAHLLRFPHSSSLRRTTKYASLLRISGALHLGIFEQPGENYSFQQPIGSLTTRMDGDEKGEDIFLARAEGFESEGGRSP